MIEARDILMEMSQLHEWISWHCHLADRVVPDLRYRENKNPGCRSWAGPMKNRFRYLSDAQQWQ